MRAAWQNQNLRRMGKFEPSPLKMLIRAFLRGNDLKAFLFLQSAFSSFPCHCQLKPTTATTTWNSKQMLYFAIFCLFRRSFFYKNAYFLYHFFIILMFFLVSFISFSYLWSQLLNNRDFTSEWYGKDLFLYLRWCKR